MSRYDREPTYRSIVHVPCFVQYRAVAPRHATAVCATRRNESYESRVRKHVSAIIGRKFREKPDDFYILFSRIKAIRAGCCRYRFSTVVFVSGENGYAEYMQFITQLPSHRRNIDGCVTPLGRIHPPSMDDESVESPRSQGNGRQRREIGRTTEGRKEGRSCEKVIERSSRISGE